MDLDETNVTGSIYDVLLRLYQRAEALGSKLGRWCTEMYSPPGVRIVKDGKYLRPREPIPNGFESNEGCRIHGQYILEVVSQS